MVIQLYFTKLPATRDEIFCHSDEVHIQGDDRGKRSAKVQMGRQGSKSSIWLQGSKVLSMGSKQTLFRCQHIAAATMAARQLGSKQQRRRWQQGRKAANSSGDGQVLVRQWFSQGLAEKVRLFVLLERAGMVRPADSFLFRRNVFFLLFPFFYTLFSTFADVTFSVY